MKFRLNMNLPPELGSMLASDGHESRHVARLVISRASDLASLGESAPSVPIFRVRRSNTDLLDERIRTAWHEIEEALVSLSLKRPPYA